MRKTRGEDDENEWFVQHRVGCPMVAAVRGVVAPYPPFLLSPPPLLSLPLLNRPVVHPEARTCSRCPKGYRTMRNRAEKKAF